MRCRCALGGRSANEGGQEFVITPRLDPGEQFAPLTNVPMTVAELREQAALARRLVRGLSGEPDRRHFRELADELEAEAAALEET